jgi:predicted deacylase
MTDAPLSLLREAFSQRYAEAREKFLAAAEINGALVESLVQPAERGVEGEELAMDVAWLGDPQASNLLVLSSATHGVEGFCGSGCQVAMLRDNSLRRAALGHTAVLLIHGVNPYGFSHWRRTNEQNIDLNRNFVDHRKPYPVDQGYAQLHALLVPASWPAPPEVEAHLAGLVRGEASLAYQAAVTGGQYAFPDGLFFGGNAPAWSNLALRTVLRRFAAHARRLLWIDFHTGLGPAGHGEMIHAGRDDPQDLARTRAIWGERVTSVYDGSSVSARVEGLLSFSAYEECPQADYSAIALEYGTVPMMQVIQALRADNWLHLHPEADAAQRAAIKRQVRDAFYTDTDEWKATVLAQARDATGRALAHLSSRAGNGRP